MNILWLTKFSETDQFVLDYAKKLNGKLPLHLELLHVVDSYSEIPLKPDGTIIELCTEVDTSELYILQGSAKQNAQKLANENSFIQKTSVLIGHLERVVAEKLKTTQYDAIMMGSHPTKLIEDFLIDTTIERLSKASKTPILCLKCDRSFEDTIERIGIFDDFQLNEPHNISFATQIALAFNAEVHLYKFMEDENASQEVALTQMNTFAKKNKLTHTQPHFLYPTGADEEQTVIQHILGEDLNMVVIPDLHRKYSSFLHPNDLVTDIANHVFSPIIIY